VKILLVVATRTEINPLLKKANPYTTPEGGIINCTLNSLEIDVLITGIGILHSTYYLTRQLTANSYDLVVNAGIAGSYETDLGIGSVIHVTEEVIGDIGFEEDGQFYDFLEKGLLDKDKFPLKDGMLVNPSPPDIPDLNSLSRVRGMTTEILHTDPEIIQQKKDKYCVEIESMEGAAVFFVCMLENVPFFEIRSISNYVGESDRQKWNIPLAVDNLNGILLKIFNGIE
jgi:futalosine hydrolase